jgi:hypothetical protein
MIGERLPLRIWLDIGKKRRHAHQASSSRSQRNSAGERLAKRSGFRLLRISRSAPRRIGLGGAFRRSAEIFVSKGLEME